MKRVDPKKLLPSSVSTGGSVGAISSSILVPASNITAKTYAKVEPEENTPQKSELRAQTFQIKSKLIEVSKLFSVKNKFTKDKNRKKRIEEERERREQREKESEKTTFNFGSKLPKLTLPRTGFLDSIKRFLLYSLLGFAVEKFLPLVPKLLEFGKMLVPAVQFLTNFAGNFLVNMVNFIDRGYKVYDGIKEQLDRIIPSNISEQFSKFSGLLNAALNAALLLGTAAIGLGGPLGSKIGGKGVAAAAAAAGALVTAIATRGKGKAVPELVRSVATIPTKTKVKSRSISKKTQKVKTPVGAGVGSSSRPVSRDAPAKTQVTDAISRMLGLEPTKKVKASKTISGSKVLGQKIAEDIAIIKKSLNKLGYQPTELIKIANDVDGQDYFTRKAAYEILKDRGKSNRVFNIPTLDIPRPADRVTKVAEPTTIEKYIREMNEAGKPVDPMLTGAAGDRAAQRAGALEAEELVGGPSKVTTKPKVTRVSPTQEITKGISKFKFGKFRKAGPGIFGALLDIGISLALGEPIDRALVSAVGAGLGGWLGGIAGSVVPGIGTIIGGTLGSMFGGILTLSLYDTIRGRDKKNLIPKSKTDEEKKREQESKETFQELLMKGSAALGGDLSDSYDRSGSYDRTGSEQYYSISDLVGFALSVGFKKENAAIAAAIAMAESSGNPNAHNTTYPDNSYGLWQINMLDEPGYKLGEERRRKFNIKDNSELFNPNLNAQIAYKISGGSNFSAWSTYTGGAYKVYLGAAQEALQKLSPPPATKKVASIDKPFALNVAKGLDMQTGYESDGYVVALLPIKQIIEKPVPIGGNGNGTFIDTTISSNIFAPALIG